MAFHVFNKMLIRVTAFIITILCVEVRSTQQNGTSNSYNLVLNKTTAGNMQSNNLQNIINQLPISQQNNVQQSESLKLARNIQQAFNSQKATNLQNANSQQSLNVQQSKLQPSLTGQQVSNLQQPAILQQPVKSLLSSHSAHPNNLLQNSNIQPQNQNAGNIQLIRQGADVSVLPHAQTLPAGNLPMNRQAPDVTVLSNLQFSPTGNLQVSHQASDISVSPNAQLSQQYSVQSNQLGTNPPNVAIITSVPSSQANMDNCPGEVMTILCPQNQLVSYTGAQPYVLDMSQITNTPLATAAPISAMINNQPSVLSIISPPQQNQQPYIAQNPAELSNQITIVKSVQPHSMVQAKYDPNQIVSVSSGQDQTFRISQSDTLPTINSILASSLTKQASKSSNLKSLLPLILDLIKDRNKCSCPNQCDCSKKTQTHFGGSDVTEGYSRQKKYGYQPDFNLNYINDSEEFDSRELRRKNKKYGKHKNVKPESAEYDYSEEFQDD